MSTLDFLRAEVGKRADRHFLSSDGEGVVLGSVTTFVDVYRLKDAWRGAPYEGGWLLRSSKTDSTRVRRVQVDDNLTGTLMLTPGYSVAPAALEPYEAYSTLSPLDIEAAIIRANTKMKTPVERALTTVAGQAQYSLGATYPYLLKTADIIGIFSRTGSGLLVDEREVPGIDWWLDTTASGTTLVANLSALRPSPPSNLIVKAYASYQTISPLTTGASATKAPDDWITWESVWELLNSPGRNVDADLRTRAIAEVSRLRETYLTDESWSLFAPSAAYGPLGTGRGL